MDKTKIKSKRKSKMERKDIQVHLKITKYCSNWLSLENYSPQSIFDEACKDLGFEEYVQAEMKEAKK